MQPRSVGESSGGDGGTTVDEPDVFQMSVEPLSLAGLASLASSHRDHWPLLSSAVCRLLLRCTFQPFATPTADTHEMDSADAIATASQPTPELATVTATDDTAPSSYQTAASTASNATQPPPTTIPSTPSLTSPQPTPPTLPTPTPTPSIPSAVLSHVWRLSSAVLAGLEYVGVVLADFLGITASPYQYVIDAKERQERWQRMEEAEEEVARVRFEDEQRQQLTRQQASMEEGHTTALLAADATATASPAASQEVAQDQGI